MTTTKTDPPPGWLSVNLPDQLSNAIIDNVNLLDIDVGQRVWVETLKTWFRYDNTAPLTPDNIVVVNDFNGTGQFVRDTGYHDPDWLARLVWYIDGIGGNDINDGLTDVTPLQTWAELLRRLGSPFYQKTPGASVIITVLDTPPDELEWEVYREGANDANHAVVISRRNVGVTDNVTGDLPLPPNADIGNTTAGAGFFNKNDIFRFPSLGTNVYAVLIEDRPPINGSLSSLSQYQFGQVVPNPLGVFPAPTPIEKISPGLVGIKSLKASPGALLLMECEVQEASLSGVSTIGCRVTYCDTLDVTTYASLIFGGTHENQKVVTSRHDSNGGFQIPVLSGNCEIGDTSNFGNNLGDLISTGVLKLVFCSFTTFTKARIRGDLVTTFALFPGESIYGGVISGVPAISNGSLTLEAGSRLSVDTTTGPSINLQSAFTLAFGQTTPVCANSATGIIAPAPSNMAQNPPIPGSVFDPLTFNGQLIENVSGARVTDTAL